MLKIHHPYRGNPHHSSDQAGAFIELLKRLGYQERKDFSVNFSEDTITILNKNMAGDPMIVQVFSREGIKE